MTTKKPVVLRIYKGDQLQGVKQFLDGQIVIGRPGDVQVALDNESVSFIHASIEDRNGDYFVSDLGSESGTFKNGERVLDAPIESGDIVQVGDFRIEFYIGVPKPKAAAPSAAPEAPAEVPKVEAPRTAAPKIETPKAEAPKPAAAPVAPKAPKAPAPEAAKIEVAPTPEKPKRAPRAKKEAPLPPAEKSAGKGGLASFPISAQVGPMSGSLAGPGTRPRTIAARPSVTEKHGRFGKTFAPLSRYTNVTDYVKPSKGTIVEVLVAWQERVISTSHFSGKRTVSIGSHPDADIQLPIFSSKSRKVPVVKIDARATVLITPEMTGELVRGQSSSSFVELLRQNRMNKDGAFYSLPLEQGEMVTLQLNDQISLIIRYVSDSPKPMVAPLLDFTTSEATGVVLACAVVAILWLYTFLYTPVKPLTDDTQNEPMRTAMIIVPPTPMPLPKVEPPPPKEEVKPQPTPLPVVVHATPLPRKVEEKAVAQPKAVTNLTTKNDPGMSANAAPNKNKTGPRQLTSPKQGGAIKTTAKQGSQMQSKSRDVSKAGVFSVFGGGGANDQLAQSTTGAGELAGLASQANGRAGYDENRAGQGLGSKVKDTGVGGTGKALEGINGGISTQGRGSGNSGYGTGGLGNHAGTKIVTGGEGESIHGTIDRDAIRRVIQANLRVIRTCYERQLNQHPDLFGKIVLSWSIGEQGRVVTTSTKSNELGSQEVAQCIMDRLKTWKFPEPPSGEIVDVDYPFFFSN